MPVNGQNQKEAKMKKRTLALSAAACLCAAISADAKIIKMVNAMSYLGNKSTAKFYRIRHGAADSDTVLAIPLILALGLQNAGKTVDFAVPWGQGHGGDYDLDELFRWIDRVVK